jgi:hypothetical protein
MRISKFAIFGPPLIATCSVAGLMIFAANEEFFRPRPTSIVASGTPADSGAARRAADDDLGVTELIALFEREGTPACFALTGLFELNEAGIVLVYRGAAGRKGRFGHDSIPGLGRVVTLEEDDCRIHLHVSFDDR